MNLKELTIIKVTPAPKKQRRAPGYWNEPELIAAIEKCIETHEEQRLLLKHSWFYAVVMYGWPLTEQAMTEEKKALYWPVRIQLLQPAFTMLAERGDTIPFATQSQAHTLTEVDSPVVGIRELA